MNGAEVLALGIEMAWNQRDITNGQHHGQEKEIRNRNSVIRVTELRHDTSPIEDGWRG